MAVPSTDGPLDPSARGDWDRVSQASRPRARAVPILNPGVSRVGGSQDERRSLNTTWQAAVPSAVRGSLIVGLSDGRAPADLDGLLCLENLTCQQVRESHQDRDGFVFGSLGAVGPRHLDCVV